MDLVESYGTPAKARAYLEAVRWPDGPVCPHCGVVNEATRLGGKAGERGLLKCNACKDQFTVTVGTVMEDSHIPLHKWVIATHLICANKKGISALSLQRMMKLGSYKSAWFMCHRIRFAMKDMDGELLTGVVEADETYVGGKAKNAHNGKPIPHKTPVVALVERGGNVKARAVTNVDFETISPILNGMVDRGAIVMTDDAQVYVTPGKGFAAHHSVNHSAKEYVRQEPGVKAHTNTVESFNSLVKRCIFGAWHNVSERHLPKYLNEISFRWNTRQDSDGERMEQALRQTEGKRLVLKIGRA